MKPDRPLRTFEVNGETRTLRPLVNVTVPWGEVWAKRDFENQRFKLIVWPFILGLVCMLFLWWNIWVLMLLGIWLEFLKLLVWLSVKVRFTVAGPEGVPKEIRQGQVFRPALPPSLRGCERHRSYITDENRRVVAEYTPFEGEERTKGELHGLISLAPEIPAEDAESVVRALLFAHNRPWSL